MAGATDSFKWELSLKSKGVCEVCDEANMCADIRHLQIPKQTKNSDSISEIENIGIKEAKRHHAKYPDATEDYLLGRRDGYIAALTDKIENKEVDKWIGLEYSAQLEIEKLKAAHASFRSQIIALRGFFKKGSPLTDMLDKIIKDHE